MARETRSDARRASEGPSPTMKGGGLHNRSAGACPPRTLECADDGEGNPLACTCGMRGPSPYDEGAPSAARLHRDQEVSPTGPSAFCSLRSPDRKRVKIRRS